MTIEVALCERCGADSPWWSASRANHGLPGCPTCGSARVSRCERELTDEERERLLQNSEGAKRLMLIIEIALGIFLALFIIANVADL